jgi:signal transduction histidine kinase
VAFPGIEIAVSDSGLGVEKEHHELVFAEFFQVRHSPHRKPAGTGLGLALTRRFVNMHGGQVWVESAGAGQGSRLICFLPLTPETKT